jgi:hypothetical protein
MPASGVDKKSESSPLYIARSAGFPDRPPIFNQSLRKYDQDHESRQRQGCEHHLNDRETGRVFAKKPTCNEAASTQEPVSGPSEPIKHISLRRPLSPTRYTRDSPPAPRAIWIFVPTVCPVADANGQFPNSTKIPGQTPWLVMPFTALRQHRTTKALIQSDTLFNDPREQLGVLAPRCDFAVACGLMSYGSSVPRRESMFSRKVLEGKRIAR